jgi:hypothetical protein
MMTETLAIVSREQMLRRIRAEYLEMPGLKLTRAQARRLWAIDEATCGQLLDSLTQDGFLYRSKDNSYAHRHDMEWVRNLPPSPGNSPAPPGRREDAA